MKECLYGCNFILKIETGRKLLVQQHFRIMNIADLIE